ncbi:MAG: toxin-antitoxin system protein [Gemmatimonadaceae bacterium]
MTDNPGSARSTTVRISLEDREILTALAIQLGKSQQDVLHDALALFRRERLLDSMNEGFAALRGDWGSGPARRMEREDWDATQSDGFSSGI